MKPSPIISLTDFQQRNYNMVFREGTKQILLIGVAEEIFAIDNRCPHEGYPLSKGSSNSNCVLTCNWHNWKFDLHTGECLMGGDNVRTYPVNIDDGFIFVDTSDPSKDEIQKTILDGLQSAVEKRQYGRIARELSRLVFNDIDPRVSIKKLICWSHERFEFGTTHAYAACADWLSLYSSINSADESALEKQIVCLTEAIDHIALDTLRRPVYPFPVHSLPYDARAFQQAVEKEDDTMAFALLNGALKAGLGMSDLEKNFAHIALEHYNDFGHSLIYVQKSSYLAALFQDPIIDACLLKALTRSLLSATREDLLPEFKQYREQLAILQQQGFGIDKTVITEPLSGQRINKSLRWTVQQAQQFVPESLFQGLLLGNAEHMSQFDLSFQDAFDRSVTQNVGWLDFTHALTFANAVHHFAVRYPSLWPTGLLQLACFYGRNSPFINDDIPKEEHHIDDLVQWKNETLEGLFDHGLGEPIHSAHVLKTSMSIFEEGQHLSDDAQQCLYLALHRLLTSPLKRKHARRIARQALSLVGKDH